MNDKIKAIEERHARDESMKSQRGYCVLNAHKDRGTLIEEYHLLEGRLEIAEAKMCGGLPTVGGHDDCHASQFKKTIRDLEATINELQDFAIWMTGCGYDFCQHDYFCKQRDKLLKEQGDER